MLVNIRTRAYHNLMRVVRHRVAKNSFFDLVGLTWPILLNLIATPILVSHMGDTSYGNWILVRSLLGFSGWFDLGMTYALVKFMAEYISTKNQRGLSASITAAYTIYLAMGAVLGISVFLFAGPIGRSIIDEGVNPQEAEHLLHLTAIGLPAFMLTIGNTAIPRGLQRYELSSLIAIIRITLVLGLAVALTFFSHDIILLMASTVTAFWITAIFSSGLALWLLNRLKVRIIFSRHYFVSMARFSFFVFLSSTGTQLFSTLDKVLIGVAFGPEFLTYYSVCITVTTQILSMAGALSGALMPAVSSLCSQGQIQRVRQYFKVSTLFVGTVVLIVGGLLLLISKPFMELWMGVEFAQKALPLFRILIAAYMGIALSAPAYHIAYGIGSPWICALGSLSGAVLALGLIYVLGHRLGLEGVGWGNMGYWLNLGLLIIVYRKLYSKQNTKWHVH